MNKINSTGIRAGNTQATSAVEATASATKRCQRGNTRLSRDGSISKTVATVRRNYAMDRILQKVGRDDSVTVIIKSTMKLKNSDRRIKTPKSKTINPSVK